MGPCTWTVSCLVVMLSVQQGLGQCPSTLTVTASTTAANTLTSLNYPSSYSNNLYCTWTIDSSSSSYQVFVLLEDQVIEANYDFLYMYDSSSVSGTQLYKSRYSSAVPYSTSSSSRYMTVYFTTDYSITLGGFSLTYMAVDMSTDVCGQTLTATTTVQTVASSSSCSSITITSTSATFIETSYPIVSAYGINYNNNGAQTVISGGSDSTYVSSTNSITITPYGAFAMTFQQVGGGTDNIVTVASTGYLSMSDYTTLTATSTTQLLVSPNYPSFYGNYIYSTIVITADDSSDSVFMEVLDWDVDYTDILYLYDGPTNSYNSLSTSLYVGLTFTSTGNSLSLTFTTDGTINLRGFKIAFNTTARSLPSCVPSSYNSYTASYTAGTVTSPNYPSNYGNYENDYTLITKANETDILAIKFDYMNLEESSGCVYDSITIYDGACSNDTRFVELCGYETNQDIFYHATGLYVLIHFKTDGSVVRTGFSMTYYITDSTTATGESKESSSTFPYWVIGIIVAVFVIIGAAVFVVWSNTRRRKAKIASGVAKPKPVPLQPKTTHQLMMSAIIVAQSGQKFKDKVKRKPQRNIDKHPAPNPPGPGTSIITVGQGGHYPVPPQGLPPPPPQQVRPGSHPPPGFIPGPPPGAPPFIPTAPHNPAYPPNGTIMNQGPPGNMPQPVLMPGFTPGPQGQYPAYTNYPQGIIPLAFQYISPTEARDQGLHG